MSCDFVKEFKKFISVEEVNYRVVHNCNNDNAIIYRTYDNKDILHIPGFRGTKEEVITYIEKTYFGDEQVTYINKVHECFKDKPTIEKDKIKKVFISNEGYKCYSEPLFSHEEDNRSYDFNNELNIEKFKFHECLFSPSEFSKPGEYIGPIFAVNTTSNSSVEPMLLELVENIIDQNSFANYFMEPKIIEAEKVFKVTKFIVKNEMGFFYKEGYILNLKTPILLEKRL